MTFLSTALVLLAVFFGWGAGAAMLVLPPRWRSHWPVFAPFLGCTVLSITIWAGVWLDLRGTDRYAHFTWIVPVALLAVALWRAGAKCWKLLWSPLWKYSLLALVTLIAVRHLASPLDQAKLGLTSVSLGSCDAADYAAGGRVFKEFARTDRAGFLGQVETVELRSVDNFPDHWLRLNHFSPAALLAWISSAFDLRLHKLVTVLGVVLLGAGVPLAFWAARALLRLGAVASLGVAFAWGHSAVNIYAVGHVSLGQLLCAPAVVMLTWIGVQAWRCGRSCRSVIAWLPLLTLTLAAILAGYHFAIVFGAVPLAAWLAWKTVRSREYGRLVRVTVLGLLAFAIAGVVFAARVAGLAERFSLFAEHDFGWFIPVFTPERWFGWFTWLGNPQLSGGPGGALVGWVLLAAWAAWFWFNRRSARATTALALVAPVLLGYGWFAHRGIEEQNNQVYDAYKWFAVFQPLILAALWAPLAWLEQLRRGRTVAIAAGFVLLAGMHLVSSDPLREALKHPPLVVDRPIADLKRAEEFADVESLNMLLEPFWARLWANGFVLRKPQYFALFTYEGRRPQPLRGTWDLRDRLITVVTGDDDSRLLGDGFYLLRRASPRFLDVTLGPGWHTPEREGGTHWAWNAGGGTVRCVNPHAESRKVTLEFGLRSVIPRHVEVYQAGRAEPLWRGVIGEARQDVIVRDVVLAPGETQLHFTSPEGGVQADGDPRPLGAALYNLVVRLDRSTPAP